MCGQKWQDVRVLLQGSKSHVPGVVHHNVDFSVDPYRLLGDLLEFAKGSYDIQLEDLSPTLFEFRQLREGSGASGCYNPVTPF